MTDKLTEIRDHLLSTFSSSILTLEAEPFEVPDPRQRQIEKEKKEIDRLQQELQEARQDLLDELEKLDHKS